MEYFFEWIGYIASFIILVSLLMRSIKRLRVINLVGATLFAIYGYLIGAYPVLIMNAGIVLINIYYLVTMLKSEEYFEILRVKHYNNYLTAFLRHHKKALTQTFGNIHVQEGDQIVFILRNMFPAGLFIARPEGDRLHIMVDYAVEAYRDFKTSAHIYKHAHDIFTDRPYKAFVTDVANHPVHARYLRKMGFEPCAVEDGRCTRPF